MTNLGFSNWRKTLRWSQKDGSCAHSSPLGSIQRPGGRWFIVTNYEGMDQMHTSPTSWPSAFTRSGLLTWIGVVTEILQNASGSTAACLFSPPVCWGCFITKGSGMSPGVHRLNTRPRIYLSISLFIHQLDNQDKNNPFWKMESGMNEIPFCDLWKSLC